MLCRLCCDPNIVYNVCCVVIPIKYTLFCCIGCVVIPMQYMSNTVYRYNLLVGRIGVRTSCILSARIIERISSFPVATKTFKILGFSFPAFRVLWKISNFNSNKIIQNYQERKSDLYFKKNAIFAMLLMVYTP